MTGYWISGYRQVALPEVRRVVNGPGQPVEPAFDRGWSETDQLAWHVARIAHDSGSQILLGYDDENTYLVSVEGGVHPGLSFEAAWTFLEGVETGIGGAHYRLRGAEQEAAPFADDYTIRVQWDSEGLSAEVNELPGCFAAGSTWAELGESVREGIALYLRDDNPEVAS